MFKVAIKKSVNYLRPIITGKVKYQNNTINNLISTILILNEECDILTTASNANLILKAEEIGEIYPPILKELQNKSSRQKNKIEKKYGINEDTTIAMHNIIIDAGKNSGKLNIIKHDHLDLAIIKFEKADNKNIKDFPIFNPKLPEIGTSICNIGFAFPEYDAFAFDEENSRIVTTNRKMNFPLFPSAGIITRNISDENSKINMFETSASVLKGQTGGIVSDINGNILGILVGSKNLPAGDNLNVNLGYAINSNAILEFLNQNDIKYNTIK